jgi:hypothetical protein
MQGGEEVRAAWESRNGYRIRKHWRKEKLA